MENILLKGAKNTRDFGSLKNVEGKRIREHCFIRSAALDKLKKSDVEILKNEYKLKTIIDLRTDSERNEKNDVIIDGVEYFHIPVFSEETAGITHEKATDKRELLNNLPDMEKLYRTMVSDKSCVSQLKRIFEIITSDDGKAVLWHCTEGKDRCGLVSAIFLLIVDVEKDKIYEDYLFTNTAKSKNGEKYYKLVRYLLRDKETAEKIKGLFSAEKKYLDAAFDEIEKCYGSAYIFIRDYLCISDEKKAEIKKKYLV